MQYKKILLPVDDSAYSLAAADHAIGLAKMAGASIVLLHCRKNVPTFLGEPNSQELLDKLTAEAERVLDVYRPSLKAWGGAYEELVVGGNPAEVIADVARIEKCDCIVMGSKGKSDFEGLLVGSVTHKVLHLAKCPLLVVR
ncbi:MAG: universal stress protein [Desulfovibrionaceae bacterium]